MRRLLFVFAMLTPPASAQAETCDDRGQDFEARIALCDQAYVDATTDDAAAYALSMKGEAQRMLGAFDAAAETLQLALTYTPENAWVWVELGNVRYEEGDMAGALAHYSAALAVDDYIDAARCSGASLVVSPAASRCCPSSVSATTRRLSTHAKGGTAAAIASPGPQA